MVSNSATFNRRTVLATVLATGVFPLIACAQQGKNPSSRELSNVKITMTFNGQTMTATLYDNASARDLASLLPLAMTIDDYADNEKIAYLPRKLTEAGSGPFSDERPGDIGYYAPWGNLVFYYRSYRYSKGLIRLGRFDDGFEPLLTRGQFPLTMGLRDGPAPA
jgi:hypothetical protein